MVQTALVPVLVALQIVDPMAKVYVYVVARDFGFAPNPFHGYCSLATCKPGIRSTARIGNWIIGLGGSRLNATGRCVFAMKVTGKINYNEYWTNPIYNDKKAIRNGSKKMLVGDNIYFNNNHIWQQAHSHHSKIDGSINNYNLNRDTKSSNVLLSNHFYYFGNKAPIIPPKILSDLGYRNMVGHSIYIDTADELIKWLEVVYKDSLNLVLSDPFDFDNSDVHYSVETNKLTKSTD